MPGGAPPDPAFLAGRILHADAAVLVLDKPAGLAVHRGPRGGPSLEDWLPALGAGRRRDPHPAHRLDADTAGCLVLGRTKPALAALGGLFAAGLAVKTYWAVARASPGGGEAGEIDAPLLKRSTAAAGWRMAVDPAGQPARTAWRVLGRGADPGGALCWLELRPLTGRTHQLRVHLASRGCPILGDPVYGPGVAQMGGGGERGGLHLLARALALPAAPPVAALAVEAPPPAAMRPALAACGWRDGGRG